MSEERVDASWPDLVRWLIVAVVVAAGIALFFALSARTSPAMAPAGQESPP